MAVSERGDSGVAGCRMQFVEGAATRERPGERVLATSRTDDEHSHRAILCERTAPLRRADLDTLAP
jgi:hypothetical protein